jgi:hypothetical protein
MLSNFCFIQSKQRTEPTGKCQPQKLWRHYLQNVASHVAQICNLLYRRIAFGRLLKCGVPWGFERLADFKSAIQQNSILRYDF